VDDTDEVTRGDVIRWLTMEETRGADRAAAELVCEMLENILDGESACSGGPTELVPLPEGATPEEAARYRDTVEDIDLDKREFLLEFFGTEDGTALRVWLKQLGAAKAKAGGGWDTARPSCVNELVSFVQRYRLRLAEDLLGGGPDVPDVE
jgi:hypothetical protein